MEAHEELLGADFVEHLVRRRNAGITPALSALCHMPAVKHIKDTAVTVGSTNQGCCLVFSFQQIKLHAFCNLVLGLGRLPDFSLTAVTVSRNRRGTLTAVNLGG